MVVVPVNPNTPVELLYERYDPVVEREVRLIFELNEFQSATESDPVIVALASVRESCCHERESPFGDERVTGA